MAKKYIVLQEQIDTTDAMPISKGAATTALAGKVAINQGTSAAGKFLKVGTDGNVTIGSPDAQVQADWSQTTTTAVDYIKAKPFQSIGAGLSVNDGVLSADVQLHFQIFETLPTPSATYAQTIALILKSATETGNIYKEYACVNTTGSTWVWEQIGETKFELNIVQSASGITINDTALQAATDSQTGLLTAADHATFAGKQDALTFDDAPTSGSANPVKSGGVYTALDGKVNKETGKSLVLDTKVSAYDAHVTDSDIHVTASQKTAWTGKQDAITSSNMLDADLVDDSSATNKFVTEADIEGWDAHVASTTNPHGVTKAQVGLGNCDNTSDANKPVSTAQQAALDAKVDLAAGSVSLGKDDTGYYFNE